jgi:ABC-type lipoprotein release transport system permease subunit
MEEWMARSLEGRRSPMMLLALFGGVALVLSAIGIYGVLAFAVAQRTREIGIRQALGADRRSILTLVLRQGLTTTGIGVGLGLIGSIALTRYLQTLLFGVGAHDVQVYAGVTMVLLAVATAACYVPARRATAVDRIRRCATHSAGGGSDPRRDEGDRTQAINSSSPNGLDRQPSQPASSASAR